MNGCCIGRRSFRLSLMKPSLHPPFHSSVLRPVWESRSFPGGCPEKGFGLLWRHAHHPHGRASVLHVLLEKSQHDTIPVNSIPQGTCIPWEEISQGPSSLLFEVSTLILFFRHAFWRAWFTVILAYIQPSLIIRLFIQFMECLPCVMELGMLSHAGRIQGLPLGTLNSSWMSISRNRIL